MACGKLVSMLLVSTRYIVHSKVLLGCFPQCPALLFPEPFSRCVGEVGSFCYCGVSFKLLD